MLAPHIFRAYDIRGIYLRDFDESGAELIGRGYGTYLKEFYPEKKLNIVVGRDGRNSGESLENAFIEGVRTIGIDVIQIGKVPSPLLYFAICSGGFDGGVMITASHNPKEYNGIKLQKRGAHAICGDQIQKIAKIVEEKSFRSGAEGGRLDQRDFREAYFSRLRELVQLDRTKKRPRLVIDAGNGITGAFAPEFFRLLGCDVTELYCEVDGDFPNHDADPERAENLNDLKELVLREKADFGFAFDGDGDRVGVVDANGNHYSADLLLLLLARDMLSRHPGAAVVFDLKSTQVLAEEIVKRGGTALMCPTGHSFVEEMMQESGALLGGEVSGHLFFAEDYYGFDDAFLAAAKILEIVWNSEKPLSEHFSDLPKTYVTPEIKVPIEEAEKFATMRKIVAHFLSLYPEALTIDGIRIDFDAGAWGIVRASNTSPYLTTRFEARSKEKLQEIQKILFDHLRKYSEIKDVPTI